VDRILRRLTRSGLQHGLGREHWGWLLLALAALVLRRARRTGDPVALSLPIRSGDRFTVTLSDPTATRPATDA